MDTGSPRPDFRLLFRNDSVVSVSPPALAEQLWKGLAGPGRFKLRRQKAGRVLRKPSHYARHYEGCTAVLCTKHGKEAAIAPPLRAMLGLAVYVPAGMDTDILGTFTGEIERVGTPLEVVIRKARMGMNATGLPFGLASEGSFGPDPRIPFIPVHHELLVFVDEQRQLQVVEQLVTNRTNYGHSTAASLEDLAGFLDRAGFPSHALVVRPNTGPETQLLYKGLRTVGALEEALRECVSVSDDGLARVETDMRAHMNPLRLAVLRRLAFRLGCRLRTQCPSCGSPGWGVVDVIKGLPCEECGYPTELVSELVEACPCCAYRRNRPRDDGRRTASAGDCPRCNP